MELIDTSIFIYLFKKKIQSAPSLVRGLASHPYLSFRLICAQDDKYWSRRKKNNMAAKRSRDARRLKENQITVRASFLERENAALRQQVAEMRKDCGRCKNTVARYEAKYGPL